MKDKNLVYKIVTESLIKGLKDAIENDSPAPWHKPWNMTNGAPMAIRKWQNGKVYRGINVWILMATGQPGPWLTYNQAKNAGGKIKDNETKNYTVICFWKINKYQDKADPNKQVTIPILRYFRVYSLEQTEGLQEKRWMKKERELLEAQGPVTDPFEQARNVWEGYKDRPELRESDPNRACYSSFFDYINMPTQAQFVAKHANQTEAFAHYYSTLFHECAHSTGHPTRLKRFEQNQNDHMFGSESYSKEELIAEMTAAYLQAFAGIDVDKVRENNVAYLRSWIKRLESDPKFAIQAASQAQKASDYILGTTWTDNPEGGDDD